MCMGPQFVPIRKFPRKTTGPGQTMPHYFASGTGDVDREKTMLSTQIIAPILGHRQQIQKNCQKGRGICQHCRSWLTELDCVKDGTFIGNI